MSAVTVNLPKSRAAVFPARCIRCGAFEPDSTWRVCTHAIGWWTVVFQSSGPRYCAEVPACRSCRGRLRRGATTRIILEWVLMFAGVGLATWALGWQPAGWGKWAIIGLGLLAILPLFVWDQIFPPLLDLTAYSNTVNFDFRDAIYAEEFRKLNEIRAVPAEAATDPDPAGRNGSHVPAE